MAQQYSGLYIHIPFCKKKCNYCDFPSWPGMEEYWEAYTAAAVSELLLKADSLRDLAIKTIFIGGGTPSLLPHPFISRILDAVHANYNVLDGCETTIEANPGTLDEGKLMAYRASGVNRLSMGLQAGQDHLLDQLGRIHTFRDFENSLALAKKHGFENINADIIFGIPDQTFEDWRDTIRKVLSSGLTHISCYDLQIEEETVFGRLHQEGLLQEMDDELDRRMYHYAIEEFQKAGFDQYEISNFSRPQTQCQHNINYWTRGPYIGIGAGAHSFLRGRRFANTPDITGYIKGIRENRPVLSEDSTLSAAEELSEEIILGLRLNRGVDLESISKKIGIDAEEKYGEKIDRLVKRKLVDRSGNVIKLTKLGLDFANLVFIEFI